MPSAATSNPYDSDAVERDLIDPDDGASQCIHTCLRDETVDEANHHQLPSMTSTILSRARRTARR